MNHFVGALEEPYMDKILKDERERGELETFKVAYYNQPGAASTDPQCSQDPDQLPESGWRPLDDWTLLRFLRADVRSGKYNHEASMARLLKALAFRRHMRADELIAKPPPELDRYEALRVRRWMGLDLSGRPAQFERLGAFLGSGNAGAFTQQEWLAHYTRDLEITLHQLREASQVRAEPVLAYNFFGDLDGLGPIWRHLGSVIPLLKFLTKEVESHYPESTLAARTGCKAAPPQRAQPRRAQRYGRCEIRSHVRWCGRARSGGKHRPFQRPAHLREPLRDGQGLHGPDHRG
jgi:hypothetical protein